MKLLCGTIILFLAASLAAQEAPAPPAQTPEPQSDIPAAQGDYHIGAGDVLDITVFGNPDLSRTATVQTNGAISLPLLGDVQVVGLTEEEIRNQLTELLGRDYLVNPRVEVRVSEYRSQFVTVVGEVNKPGRKPLKGPTRLIDVLVECGGFTTRASGDVIVTRAEGTFPNGEKSLSARLQPTFRQETQDVLELPVKSGDIITASPKSYIVVEGEVARPNRYVIDGELTVTGAVSLAGGLTRFGSNDVKVRRVDPTTGLSQIIDVDLKAVRKGKADDLRLQPNDVVTVPKRLF